jgi:predicted HicB family RNase H-like nuclease
MEKDNKDKILNVKISKDTHELLSIIANEKGLNLTALVRMVLVEYSKNEEVRKN